MSEANVTQFHPIVNKDERKLCRAGLQRTRGRVMFSAGRYHNWESERIVTRVGRSQSISLLQGESELKRRFDREGEYKGLIPAPGPVPWVDEKELLTRRLETKMKAAKAGLRKNQSA